jgi:hypothetical protein
MHAVVFLGVRPPPRDLHSVGLKTFCRSAWHRWLRARNLTPAMSALVSGAGGVGRGSRRGGDGSARALGLSGGGGGLGLGGFSPALHPHAHGYGHAAGGHNPRPRGPSGSFAGGVVHFLLLSGGGGSTGNYDNALRRLHLGLGALLVTLQAVDFLATAMLQNQMFAGKCRQDDVVSGGTVNCTTRPAFYAVLLLYPMACLFAPVSGARGSGVSGGSGWQWSWWCWQPQL